VPVNGRITWRDLAYFAPAVLLFLFLAGDGLRAGLFPDEMMNIHGYWKEPWSRLLLRNLLFFDGGYRPAGALFYRPLFDAFGFNPLPYRLVCFGFLLGNMTLVYAFVRRMADSGAIAGMAAVLFAYNAYCTDLYYSSGTIYDLMCFACFAGALLLNAVWRSERPLGVGHIAALVVLQIIALNAKEMAVTLPLAIAAHEFLFHKRGERDLRAAAFMLAIVGLGMWGRLAGFGNMADNPAYRPSLEQLKQVSSVYVGQLLYLTPMASTAVVAAFAGVISACAVLVRVPHIRFAAVFALVTPLPVLLIQQRSLYVMYLPMLGFAMLGASLAGALLPSRLKNGWISILLPAACALLLLPAHLHHRQAGTLWVAIDEPKVRSIVSALDRQLPRLPKGGLVYFQEDPFADDDWILTFIFRLYYRDDTVEVHRSKRSEDGPAGHHAVLTLRENPWVLSVSKP
jgi:hypothetical protein